MPAWMVIFSAVAGVVVTVSTLRERSRWVSASFSSRSTPPVHALLQSNNAIDDGKGACLCVVWGWVDAGARRQSWNLITNDAVPDPAD